jgi:hypothetical protein
MEKFIEYLDSSARNLRTADHMAYVTYPLLKEKRILFEILNNIYTSVLNIVNAILQYEYFYKRISLYKESRDNLAVFKERCASRYQISQDEISKINELFSLIEKHKNSPFEFVRKDKIVIMGENLHTDFINLEKIKAYLLLSKDVLRKAEVRIRGRI